MTRLTLYADGSSAEALVLPRSYRMRLPAVALASCLAAGGCAWTTATDPCARALAGTQIGSAYRVETVGPLPDASGATGLVFGWVAEGVGGASGEGFAGSLIYGAAVSVDSLLTGTATDSLSTFRLRLPPGRHRLAFGYAGFDRVVVPVEVRSGRGVEVRARLGTYGPGADVCVSAASP